MVPLWKSNCLPFLLPFINMGMQIQKFPRTPRSAPTQQIESRVTKSTRIVMSVLSPVQSEPEKAVNFK